MPTDIPLPFDVAELARRYQIVMQIAHPNQQVWVKPGFPSKRWSFALAVDSPDNFISSCSYERAERITANPARYVPSVQDLYAAESEDDWKTLFYASPTTVAVLTSIETFPWLEPRDVEPLLLTALKEWRSTWEGRLLKGPQITVRRARIHIAPEGVYAQEVPA